VKKGSLKKISGIKRLNSQGGLQTGSKRERTCGIESMEKKALGVVGGGGEKGAQEKPERCQQSNKKSTQCWEIEVRGGK